MLGNLSPIPFPDSHMLRQLRILLGQVRRQQGEGEHTSVVHGPFFTAGFSAYVHLCLHIAGALWGNRDSEIFLQLCLPTPCFSTPNLSKVSSSGIHLTFLMALSTTNGLCLGCLPVENHRLDLPFPAVTPGHNHGHIILVGLRAMATEATLRIIFVSS